MGQKITATVARSIASKVHTEILEIAKNNLTKESESILQAVNADPDFQDLQQAYQVYKGRKESLQAKHNNLTVTAVNNSLGILYPELDYSAKETLRKKFFNNIPTYEDIVDDIIIKSASAETGTNLQEFIENMIKDYTSKL